MALPPSHASPSCPETPLFWGWCSILHIFLLLPPPGFFYSSKSSAFSRARPNPLPLQFMVTFLAEHCCIQFWRVFEDFSFLILIIHQTRAEQALAGGSTLLLAGVTKVSYTWPLPPRAQRTCRVASYHLLVRKQACWERGPPSEVCHSSHTGIRPHINPGGLETRRLEAVGGQEAR